jgi:type I restriction enzyme S subunit
VKSGWTAVALGELMIDRAQNVNPVKFPDETFELFSIPAFDEGTAATVTGSDIGSTKQLVQRGDVLLSKIVPHIRRSWIVRSESANRLLASGEWIVFRGAQFDATYLRHLLTSDRFHAHLMATVAGVGGSLMRARPASVARIQVQLPSLDEQRRLGRVLDAADSLRVTRRQSLVLAKRLLEARFVELFGDPQLNERGFRVGVVADMIASADYGSSTKAQASGQVPVLRMGNITRDGNIDVRELKYLDLPQQHIDRYTVRRGDVIFNRTNSPDLVGKTAVFHEAEPMAYAGYLIRVRMADDHSPEYLAGYLNSRHGKRVLRGMAKTIIGMANINAQELRAIKIPIPPPQAQAEFDNIVCATRVLEGRFADHLGRLNELGAALQHRAFARAV